MSDLLELLVESGFVADDHFEGSSERHFLKYMTFDQTKIGAGLFLKRKGG